jgi:Zn-dependent peptidase ImmA (M78 family)
MPPKRLTRDQVEDQAQKFLKKHGFKRMPIDVRMLAESAGYRVAFRYFDDADISGTVMQGADGKVILGINTLHAPVRQRFSIAHELGHAQLHLSQTDTLFVDPPAGVLFRDSRASLGEDPREINANQFAAAVLMPRNMVHEALKSIAKSSTRFTIEEAVGRLAKQFDVSIQAMKYRLVVLGYIEPD